MEMHRPPPDAARPPGPRGGAVPATTGGRALATCRERLHRAIGLLVVANTVLRDTVAARDHALVELREAERDQDAFVVAAVHELKTPLTAVKGRAQLMRLHAGRGAGLDQAHLLAGLRQIESEADRLTAALDGLIDEVNRPLPGPGGDQGSDASGPFPADGTA